MWPPITSRALARSLDARGIVTPSFAIFAASRESSVPGGDNVSREEREDAKSVYLLLTGTFRELPRASARDWQSFPRPLKLR
ncbi:protein of unknown function [Methanoculleus bourgensis]|uniref:Uncharacterized protein n=1 Tax=Methanoculleus bourgensis TaxID=83986 RepID=A0A0X3BJU1_9EURY|nr:protein of unknown function [Methanoculleus bourgensis]